MLVDIQNERPVGYITLDEYAEKYNVKNVTVRAWERGGKLRTLKITSGGHTILFIPADEPLPHLNPTGVARKGRNKKVDKLAWPPDEYYTVREFAQKIGASQFTVWQWCHRGYLKYFKSGPGKRARLLISKDTPIPEKCYYQKGVMK